MTALEIIFWILLFFLVHAYFLYPLLSFALARVAPIITRKDDNYLPSVVFIISAYNEERVLREKLQNTFSLDYSKEKFAVAVISDGSDDATESIALSFPEVILIREKERVGKSEALNRAFAQFGGEIGIFSDANVMYEKDSIRHFVRNFADERVGCVCGKLRYFRATTPASKSENIYWRYESALRHWEGLRGALISPNGTVFAIRRELFLPVSPIAANDFQTAEDIAAQGYLITYEPNACARECSTLTLKEEFLRKARIIAGCAEVALRRIFKMPLHRAFRMLSHKILRWFAPVILPILFVLNITVIPVHKFYVLTMLCQCGFYLFALAGTAPVLRKIPLFYIPLYYVVVNSASLVGLWRFATRTHKPIWESPKSNRLEQPEKTDE